LIQFNKFGRTRKRFAGRNPDRQRANGSAQKRGPMTGSARVA